MQVLRTNIKCTVYSLIQYENTDKKKTQKQRMN